MDDNTYGLDFHSQMILDEYRENLPIFRKMQEIVTGQLRTGLADNDIIINALESRIKEEKSLAGKLELKGYKYNFLSDITDILGCRVITFYTDDVDKTAALVEKHFDVDWNESVDKRKLHELDSFGYLSLHYICRIPKSMYFDPEMPQINEFRFEIQMRTALQHVWATMNHDTGYKTGVEIPREHLRNMNRLAGLLELADEQFSRIRTEITDYRRRVQALVASGNFDEVPLNGDTFRSYLELEPFRKLAQRMAAINQAEIYKDSFAIYLDVFHTIGFRTIGEIEKMKNECSEQAYQLTTHQLAGTDLDIIAATLSLQNLLVVYLLKNGGGQIALTRLFQSLGNNEENANARAKRNFEIAKHINII